ncbi:MAG: FKBP-type peptidyl-prolyl cis-trans isomerase [Bdellovibrionota bacterium]
MKATHGSRVWLHYTLSTDDVIVDSTEGRPPLEIVLGKGTIHPALEAQLLGLEAGEHIERVLDANVGFGEYDPKLKIQIARKKLPERFQDLSQGMQFETLDPDKKLKLFRVIEATPAFIVIDGNHPLAGQTLHLSAQIERLENSAQSSL